MLYFATEFFSDFSHNLEGVLLHRCSRYLVLNRLFYILCMGPFKCYVTLEGVGGYMPKRYEALRGGGGGYVSVT